MNTKTRAMLCVVVSTGALAGGWLDAARASDSPRPNEEQPDFQPGDTIVVRQRTALRIERETLAWIPAGTHLVVAKVQGAWLATTVQEDGQTVGGWISSDGVSIVVTNSIGMKLVLIPAGEFLMGSAESPEEVGRVFRDYGTPDALTFADEHPQHRVRITRPLYLGVYEVTVGQFRQFVQATRYQTDAEKGTGGFHGAYGMDPKTGEPDLFADYSWRNAGFEQTDEHPVVNVSWNDAAAFCEWLSRKESREYRLPTEAEWEYACRAGTTTRYYHGDDPEGLATVGNVADATLQMHFPRYDWTLKARDGYVFTAPVGQFKPNAFGLYDMHGNVSEWCADWFGSGYYGKSPTDDPQGPASGSERADRGGGWSLGAGACRSAARGGSEPDSRASDLGFRVALVLPDESSSRF